MCTYIININDPDKIRLFDEFLKNHNLKPESKSYRINKNDLLPKTDVRQGWEASFQNMSINNDDTLILNDNFSDHKWDANEWEWK